MATFVVLHSHVVILYSSCWIQVDFLYLYFRVLHWYQVIFVITQTPGVSATNAILDKNMDN